jgi:hypothetical protein
MSPRCWQSTKTQYADLPPARPTFGAFTGTYRGAFRRQAHPQTQAAALAAAVPDGVDLARRAVTLDGEAPAEDACLPRLPFGEA